MQVVVPQSKLNPQIVIVFIFEYDGWYLYSTLTLSGCIFIYIVRYIYLSRSV